MAFTSETVFNFGRSFQKALSITFERE